MLKKFLAILLCLCMVFSLAACGNNKENETHEDEIVEDYENDDNEIIEDNNNDATVDENEEGDTTESEDAPFDCLVKLEDTVDKDSDVYKAIKDAQGKISYIDSLTSAPTFIAEGKWYIPGMLGAVSHAATIPANTMNIKYYDNMSIGANLVYVVDGKISSVGDDGEFRYNDIPFNQETDMIVYDDSYDAPWIEIITKQDDGYVVNQWAPVEDDDVGTAKKTEDGKYIYELYTTGKLEVINTGDKGVRDDWVDGYDITADIAEIFALPNGANGYDIVAKTTTNDLYLLEELHEVFGVWTFDATTYDPWLENVDRIFSMENLFTVPVYSKCDEPSKMFTKSYGESIVDKSDDTEVTFLIPDGLSATNVVNVLGVGNAVCFIFDNGDIYLTKEMSDDAFAMNVSGEFELHKHDVLSEANRSMKFKSFAADTVGIIEKYIYALTNDGYVYAYDVGDFIYE